MKDQTQPPLTLPRMLDAKELAGVLKLGVRTIWRMNDAGKLPEPVRLGSSVRWREDAIQEWLDSGCPSRREARRVS